MKLYDRLLDRFSVAAVRGIGMCGLVMATVLCAVAFGSDWGGHRHSWPPIHAGHEVAEWHLLPGGQVRVHSRITLTEGPEPATFMRIELPYESGQIESALLDGRPVSWFEMNPGGESEPGLYLALNTSGAALRNDLVEIVWTFAFEEVPWEGEYYSIHMQSLIPVKSYALVAVLEEDCGFEIPAHPELPITRPYRGIMKTYTRSIGTCGLVIRPIDAG